MAQPPPYSRAFSFTDYTANHPSDQQPGVRLDSEYDAIKVTFDAIRVNLALIQRDDGALANGSVGPDQLDPALTLGLRSVTDWAPGHSYIANDAVWTTTGKLYRCVISHTSAAAFATDLNAGKWALVTDMEPQVQNAVNAAIAAGQITVGVDTSTFAGKGSNNVFTGTNTFSGAATFSAAAAFGALPTTSIGPATSAQDYAAWRPTDYGAGKPGMFVRKKAAAGAWAIEIDDGAAGSGTLDLPATTTFGGAAPASQAQITDLTIAIRRARNLAINAR